MKTFYSVQYKGIFNDECIAWFDNTHVAQHFAGKSNSVETHQCTDTTQINEIEALIAASKIDDEYNVLDLELGKVYSFREVWQSENTEIPTESCHYFIGPISDESADYYVNYEFEFLDVDAIKKIEGDVLSITEILDLEVRIVDISLI